MRVADKEFYGVNNLAPHGPHQGQFVGWIQGHGVRQIAAILIRPLVGSRVRGTDAQDLLGGRIKEEKLPRRIGHNHTIGDTSQNQLQKFLLPSGFLFCLILCGDVPENEHHPKPFATVRENGRRGMFNVVFPATFG